MRVLVVEDFEPTARAIVTGLRREGMAVDIAYDGDEALGHLALTRYDVVVLDRDLPGVHGDEICRRLAAGRSPSRILMLTAAGSLSDRVDGLGMGADDYLAKPFDLNILLVRLKSLLRRTAWQNAATQETPPPTLADHTDEYSFNHRTIRFDTLELVAPNRMTHLTLMEADLLRHFTEREGQIVSRKQILEEVWRVHEDTDTRAIDNFIVRLRRYIEDDPAEPQHLLTVRGVGYRFIANP